MLTALDRLPALYGTARLIRDLVGGGRRTAVAAERHRMRTALHDSVGAMPFAIGAQVRDLHQTVEDNPTLDLRLRRVETDIAAALRESLLALSESTRNGCCRSNWPSTAAPSGA